MPKQAGARSARRARSDPPSSRRRAVPPASGADDIEPLTPAQVRELRCRVADLEDRTRYLLASVFSQRFVLFYDVSDDTFVMNDPTGATLFKRRRAAMAVRRLLDSGIEVLSCQVDDRGGLVLRSVAKALRAARRPPA